MKTFVIAWNWMWDIEDPYIKFVKAESLEKAKECYWYCIMKFDRSQSIAEIEKEAEEEIPLLLRKYLTKLRFMKENKNVIYRCKSSTGESTTAL